MHVLKKTETFILFDQGFKLLLKSKTPISWTFSTLAVQGRFRGIFHIQYMFVFNN